ncbi:oligo-1,6-glucosidase [Pseudonocardia zijingensis]|uniref:Oligo-1,6-glucosidase n=1 Tax=Pseudonocardia zijingensis TaxID=153376 RepID=A0ABP3ZK21_9PSEU
MPEGRRPPSAVAALSNELSADTSRRVKEHTVGSSTSTSRPGSAPGTVAQNQELADQWWKSAVVYQIYPRSFADSNSDGVGDLGGIKSRLDYLATLGVDVLWLSPVYPSPQADHGYDITNYQDIDPLFGSMEDLDELLRSVHEREMRLIMDIVVNHTSDEHPWFQDSRSSTTSPKRDWYWWRPPRYGMEPGTPGAEPTNWASIFSGPAWEFDDASGEYYLHLFSRKQPDLNWENPEVRHAVYAMMRWWLDRGVDGFRMDVINLISKEPDLPDGHHLPHQPYADGSEHFVCGPHVHDFLQEMRRNVFAGRPEKYLVVGEMPGVTVDEARLFTDPRRAELDMVFQFEHVQLDQGDTKWDYIGLDLRDLKASLGRWQAGLADVGWNSLYWSNHDQPRVVSRYGNDREHRVASAKMLATVLHLHRGTPYIFQGEELGMTNAPFEKLDEFRDIESLNHYDATTGSGAASPDDTLAALRLMSRDNARTPMQWDTGPWAGFSTHPPWIQVNPNYSEVNAKAALADPDSVFHHYRKLIELRHAEPVIVHGSFEMLLPHDEQIYAFLRRLDDVELLVLGNFSSADAAVDLPDASEWAHAELLIGTPPEPGTVPLVLRPWEGRVYRRTGQRRDTTGHAADGSTDSRSRTDRGP